AGAVLTGALATTATPASNVGSYTIAQGTLAANANYAVNYTASTLSVTPAALAVVADAQSREYGLANPTLTYQATGFRNSDTAGAVLTGALATTATQASNVASYPITQGTLAANANYAVNYTASTLSVTPAALAVVADAQNREY